MGVPIRVDDELYNEAKSTANAEYRSISGQIAFWARVGKTALDNPDLPIEFIRDLLIARAMDRSSAEPFEPSTHEQ
ncbi:MAG: ParD-like family protein [Holophagae bacterium]|nr:ParD-like family protein [Holophagae bacterium]